MNLEEQKLAVCGKLPELIINGRWKDGRFGRSRIYNKINWPTEGLQVCNEAEKLMNNAQLGAYASHLGRFENLYLFQATYEQRLEALCRVWWPERF